VRIGSSASEPSGTPPASKLLRATLAALILLVGGVVVSLLPSLHPAVSHLEATMHPTATVDGRTVHGSATTDLPDGALVSYYYLHEPGSFQGQEPDGGLATVEDGRIAFDTDFTGWPGGSVTLYVEFGVGSGWDQPEAVVDRFGADGERIAGPQAVSDSGDPPHLIATTRFVLPTR
jgi:hypothetical protein